MRIVELFNPSDSLTRGVTWQKMIDNNFLTGYSLTVKNSSPDSKPLEYGVHFSRSHMINGVVEFSFAALSDSQPNYSKFDTGNKSIAVFSGVAAITRAYMSSHQSVGMLYFTSNDSTRSVIYDRLARKIAKEMNWILDRDLAVEYDKEFISASNNHAAFAIVNPTKLDSIRQDVYQKNIDYS